MSRSKITLMVFLMVAPLAKAQTVRDIQFYVDGERIVITYDLYGEGMVHCDILVQVYSLAKGLITIGEASLTGDLKRQRPGSDKVIYWHVLQDLPYLDEEIKVVMYPVSIEMIEKNPGSINTKNTRTPAYDNGHIATNLEKYHGLGGPGNVLKSMIWPGWGDIAVNDGDRKTKGALIMTAYAGAAGFGIYSKMQSDGYYQEYMAATDQADMDEYYKLANDYHQKFLIATSVAALIWTVDVLYVFGRGIKNKSKQRQLRKFSMSAAPGNVQLTCKF